MIQINDFGHPMLKMVFIVHIKYLMKKQMNYWLKKWSKEILWVKGFKEFNLM